MDDEPSITDLLGMALRDELFTVAVVLHRQGGAGPGDCVPARPGDVSTSCCPTATASRSRAPRRVATEERVPIVFLTAGDATEDKVSGLTAGGDD